MGVPRGERLSSTGRTQGGGYLKQVKDGVDFVDRGRTTKHDHGGGIVMRAVKMSSLLQ